VSVKEEIYNIDHVTVFSFLIFFKENRKKELPIPVGFFHEWKSFSLPRVKEVTIHDNEDIHSTIHTSTCVDI
jgi:hypothetical protein